MKAKAFIPFMGALLITSGMLLAQSQRPDGLQRFVATTEAEVYELYEGIFDSLRLSNEYVRERPTDNIFIVGYLKELNSRDTLATFVQMRNSWGVGERVYMPYLSNRQPVAFYDRFVDYLKSVVDRESYFLRGEATAPLYWLRLMLIKRYESGDLSGQESAEALRLMEKTTLMMINDEHAFSLKDYNKYVTDNIRSALIDVLENPYYPPEYLEYYMSRQDTTRFDLSNVPDSIAQKYFKRPIYSTLSEEEDEYYLQLSDYKYYRNMGIRDMGGASPGQAYLRKKEEDFVEKGYMPIKFIEKYAYESQDELLIKHIREFKKKHPDYPLKYF